MDRDMVMDKDMDRDGEGQGQGHKHGQGNIKCIIIAIRAVITMTKLTLFLPPCFCFFTIWTVFI